MLNGTVDSGIIPNLKLYSGAFMDKYDEAIDFLNKEDEKRGGGTYFGECADLMTELLVRIYELEEKYKSKPPKKNAWEKEFEKRQIKYGRDLAKRAKAYWERVGSSAKAEKE